MAKGLAIFKSDVRAALKQHCVKCHGGDKTRGDFDLTTRAALLKGGDEGVSVIPGKSKQSRLLKLIAHEEKPFMPAKKPKLPSSVIAKIAQWIDLGAPRGASRKDSLRIDQVGGIRLVTKPMKKFLAPSPIRSRKSYPWLFALLTPFAFVQSEVKTPAIFGRTWCSSKSTRIPSGVGPTRGRR